LKENLVLCVLIGYELGFEVWAVNSDPELVFSKRNQGISILSYLENSSPVQFALSSLYHTSDFPLNSFQIYSPTTNSIIKQVQTEKPIKDLQSNSLVLVASQGTKLSIYERRDFNLINNLSLESQDLIFSLSNLYIAYTLPNTQETIPESDLKLSDMISKTVQTIAESSLSKLKNYIDPGKLSQYKGRIWVKNLMTNSLICEIQAFNSSIPLLSFSRSSHLLVAAASSGTTFHVYRINPSKAVKGEYKSRFFLLYKLHRGITPAEIVDISISDDDSIVAATSLRGTCHVFRVDPCSEALIYNQEVFCRVKLASFLEPVLQARTFVVRAKNKNYELVTFNCSGQVNRFSLEPRPEVLNSTCIVRGKDFKEVPFNAPLMTVVKKTGYDRGRLVNQVWTPLVSSQQFAFFKTEDKYFECLDREAQVFVADEDKTVPAFTVLYENSRRIQDALSKSITGQGKEFVDGELPTYQLYLAHHFSK
jgi:hypothetical protein